MRCQDCSPSDRPPTKRFANRACSPCEDGCYVCLIEVGTSLGGSILRLTRMFEPLGLSPEEESAYRALIHTPGADAAAVAALMNATESVARSCLTNLEKRGLANRTGETLSNFTASAPAPALEVLIREREEELSKLRVEATQLHSLYRQVGASRDLSDTVEIVIGQDAVLQRFDQLQRGAKSISMLSRPPWARKTNPVDAELVGKGVNYRIIWDSICLDDDAVLKYIQESAAMGDKNRVLADVPLKLAIADDDRALVPVGLGGAGATEGALLIYAPPIIQALTALFESLWNKAVPFTLGMKDISRDTVDADLQEILSLLAVGASDATIARRIGVSKATLSRRIGRLMTELGATTRFQAAMQAMRQGWVDLPD